MKKEDLYFTKIEKNNVAYTIDKLRLKTYITFQQYSILDFHIRTFHSDKVKQFYISDKKQNFHYNWNIEIEEGKSFYFGFHHNSEGSSNDYNSYNFTIEFNPNKLHKDKLLMDILAISGRWCIIRYDIAMDIPVSILDIIYDKSRKRKAMIFSNGYDDRTYTIGASGNGHIKIYNKKKEADLNITGDLTRVEITRELDNFYVGDMVIYRYDKYFPDIYLNQYVYSLSDYELQEKEKTTRALLFAVQNGYPLRDLTRTYRQKIKKMLEGGYQIKFDNESVTLAMRRVMFQYFLENPLVIWK